MIPATQDERSDARQSNFGHILRHAEPPDRMMVSKFLLLLDGNALHVAFGEDHLGCDAVRPDAERPTCAARSCVNICQPLGGGIGHRRDRIRCPELRCFMPGTRL
jgi:hypothetical protein